MGLAVELDDRAAIRRYADRFLALGPAPESSRTFRLVRYMFDPATTTSLLDRLLDTLGVNAVDALNGQIYNASDSGEISVRTYRHFATKAVSEDVWWSDPAVRYGLLAASLGFRGHAREAARLLAHYPGMIAWGTLTSLALAGMVPADTADAVFRRWLREAPGPLGGADMRGGFPPPWWAARRDTSALKLYADRLTSRAGRRAVPEPYWSSATEAYLTLARGDSLEALRRFQALPRAVGQVWFERLTLARLLLAFHREEEALAELDRGFPFLYLSFDRVPWAIQHARLAEKLGAREKAKYWYGYVVRVWRHADPELQPIVTEAREGLHRLTADTGS
jgi:serine/threonine-protein kinase